VQAPKTRSTVRVPAPARPWRLLLVAGGLALVAIAVGVGFLLTGGGSGSAASALRDAGCSFETFPAQRAQHVEQLPEGFEYNSNPPSSGPHNPIPAPWDVYADPVDPIRYVHNLEHGGVVIQYGDDVPEETVQRLVDWYRESPNGILIAPLPGLGDQISLAAWNADVNALGEISNQRGILAKCPTFDEDAFDAFLEAYRFKGPERFPPDALEPGE
jgi:hypothetical protein